MTRALHGRQARMRGGRQVKHTVRVTGEQEARLQSIAAAQGVSVARLLVETTLAGEGPTPSQRRAWIADLLRARTELARMGSNVNQLAKVANMSGRVPLDVARLTGEIRESMARLEHASTELRAA